MIRASHGSANHFDMLENGKKIDWPYIDDKNRRFRLLNMRLESVWTHLFSVPRNDSMASLHSATVNWPNTIIIFVVMDAATASASAAVTVLLLFAHFVCLCVCLYEYMCFFHFSIALLFFALMCLKCLISCHSIAI